MIFFDIKGKRQGVSWGASGRRFKSSRPDQLLNDIVIYGVHLTESDLLNPLPSKCFFNGFLGFLKWTLLC